MAGRLVNLPWLLLLFLCFTGSASATPGTLQSALHSFQEGDFDAARSALEKLQLAHPELPELNYYLARSYIKERNYKSALKLLRKSLKVDATRADTHYLLGITYISLLADVGVFKKIIYANNAKKAWESALELDNTHLQARFALASYYMNAPGIAGGDLDKAEQQIKILRQHDGGYAELATAILMEKKAQIAAAATHFEAAVNEIDDRAGPLFNQANFYLRQNRFDDALTKLQMYIASDNKRWDDPGDLFVHILKANIMVGLGKSSTAKSEFEKALLKHPGDALRKFITERMNEL